MLIIKFLGEDEARAATVTVVASFGITKQAARMKSIKSGLIAKMCKFFVKVNSDNLYESLS